MYDYLLDKGYEARWEGPKLSSHDLVCPDEEFEVKFRIGISKSKKSADKKGLNSCQTSSDARREQKAEAK